MESGDALFWVLRGLGALALIFLPLYILFSLQTPEGRKRLVVDLVLAGGLLLAADWLNKLSRGAKPEAAALPEGGPAGLDRATEAIPAIFNPDPPQWLSVLVIVLLSLLGAAVLVGLFWWLRQRRKPEKTAWEKLAEEAQAAIEAIQTGGDFSGSILRCYQQMMKAVKEEKGLAREKAMTPREFEEHLVQEGLPSQPVRRLTRLFEGVRYGSQAAGPAEESEALACLTEIVQACRWLGEPDANN
jgi:hypothetical protein